MIGLAILGLVLPGYALARALRLPAPWAAAFPFSALLLAATVIAFTLAGARLRFDHVLGAVTGLGVLAFVAGRVLSPASGFTAQLPADPAEGRALRVSACGLAAIVVLGMAVRTTLFPLSGADTLFRWDNLARTMLTRGDLSYYPPLSHRDFQIYLFPDAIPPLVSTVYWWLYAARGGPDPAWTSVPVVLQAISCLALTWHAARGCFGASGGWLALVALSSSPLFLSGVAMGQETGYTALSVAGQVAFGLAAARAPGPRLAVAAGLFAGLGGLARDYGPALSLVGFAVLASSRQTRRLLPAFCLTALACAGPWYVRNVLRTGNPLYPQDLGHGIPANPIYADIIATYKTIFGIRTFSAAKWLGTVRLLVQGAPVPLLAGLAGLVVGGRRAAALGPSALLVALIWLSSVGYTAGDVEYSLRVLTPVWAVLSVACGAFGPSLAREGDPGARRTRRLAALALALCGVHGALCSWAHPAPASDLVRMAFRRRREPLDHFPYYVEAAAILDRSELPSSGILIDNMYLAVALQRRSRFVPVPIWDPDVAFVFDRGLSPTHVRGRLRSRGIGLVATQINASNNRYLSRIRFYREDSKRWLLALEVPGLDYIFILPAAAG